MSEPFLGEIRIISFNFPPKGWTFCNGQILSINQNQALFSILGTTYGGNGVSTFALPNLQGRTAIHPGQNFTLGQSAGEDAHTLITPEIPQHNHTAIATSTAADQTSPANGFWANGGISTFSSNPPNTSMAGQALSATGASQPHPNLSPYQTLNFIIALAGIFPSRT